MSLFYEISILSGLLKKKSEKNKDFTKFLCENLHIDKKLYAIGDLNLFWFCNRDFLTKF